MTPLLTPFGILFTSIYSPIHHPEIIIGKGTKDITTKSKSSYPSKPSDFLPPKSSASSDSDLDGIVVLNKGVRKV